MKSKQIKETLHAKGFNIEIYTEDFNNEYISLTDIARYKSDDPFIVINNWMRVKDTIAFLGLWEQLHNPSFKPIEFDRFKKGNIRDDATIEQLLVLANLESLNAEFIKMKLLQNMRLLKLNKTAISQLTSLLRNSNVKQIKRQKE